MPAAVVLAGGGPDPNLAPSLPSKAFLVLGGRPLVARVTQALRRCALVDRIVVVGPPGPLADLLDPSIEVVAERTTMMDNLSAAAEHLGGTGQVLAVASDLPLLSAEAVEDFLRRCTGDADFYYAVVPQAAVERRFPTARKTYVRVTDGTFCGGSVILFSPGLLDRIRPLVEKIITARKKPWALASLFGWSVVTKFVSGRLSIADLEARAHEVAGVRARAVVIERPELALDVDAEHPENLEALAGALASDGEPAS